MFVAFYDYSWEKLIINIDFMFRCTSNNIFLKFFTTKIYSYVSHDEILINEISLIAI